MAPIVRERLYKNLLRGKELPETYLLDRLAYLTAHSSRTASLQYWLEQWMTAMMETRMS